MASIRSKDIRVDDSQHPGLQNQLASGYGQHLQYTGCEETRDSCAELYCCMALNSNGCSTFFDLPVQESPVFRIYLYLFCIGSDVDQKTSRHLSHASTILNLTQTMVVLWVVAAFAIGRGTGFCIARPFHLVCSAVWHANYSVAVGGSAIHF